jgi:acetyltransferase-like isoleucine patch superfamily enzyme
MGAVIFTLIVFSIVLMALAVTMIIMLRNSDDEPIIPEYSFHPVAPFEIQDLIDMGYVKVGKNVNIDKGVWIGHPDSTGKWGDVVIGDNCYIRTGTVIYTGVRIGNNTKTGQHAVIRENTTIGDNCLIGTHVTIENNSRIGNNVSIETGAHVTGNMTIEDGVFYGAYVVATNDLKMNWQRKGHGQGLKGATIKKNARIGSGAILLPAVVIGENSIVSVGEVVRKSISDNILYFTHRNKPIYQKIQEVGK